MLSDRILISPFFMGDKKGRFVVDLMVFEEGLEVESLWSIVSVPRVLGEYKIYCSFYFGQTHRWIQIRYHVFPHLSR